MAESQVRYDLIPTEIEGVDLRVLEGTKPNVPSEIIQLFLELARRFKVNKQEIAERNKLQGEWRKKLIQFAESIPGLRGIRSAPDDFGLLAVLREKVMWDRELLRASLGIAYPAHVSEELIATVTLSSGITTEEKLREGLAKLLLEIGVPEADIPKLLKTEVELSVDVEKITELVAAKRMDLLPGTKDVDVEWAIEAEPLKTPQKAKKGVKEEAGEKS